MKNLILLTVALSFTACMTEPIHPNEKRCKESFTPVNIQQTDSGYVNNSKLCDETKAVK